VVGSAQDRALLARLARRDPALAPAVTEAMQALARRG